MTGSLCFEIQELKRLCR